MKLRFLFKSLNSLYVKDFIEILITFSKGSGTKTSVL